MSFAAFALALSLQTLPPGAPDPDRTLSGTVVDATGSAIAGAVVTVRCEGTQPNRVVASPIGAFDFANLPAATCEVEGTSAWFEPRIVRVDLTGASPARVVLTLDVQGFASEIVVTPGRGIEERVFDLPEAISVTTRAELEARPHQLLPEVLKEEPGILLQQTTRAQASPFIRGFSAQRIVYLLDGVRFNTSIFRSGATQYLGWISPQTVERMEVVRGPGSVQYGSDALGGTVNVISVKPPLSSGPTTVSGSVGVAVGTADVSGGLEGTTLIQGRAASVQIGGAVRHVDDLRAGRGGDSRAAVTRFLGLDSGVVGPRLLNTGFRQGGVHVLGRARVGDGYINGVYLHEQQYGVRRYDRELGGDGRFRAEFAPQRLDSAMFQYERSAAGPFADVRVGFSLNRQQDDRLDQASPRSRIEREGTTVLALGYQVQASRHVGSRHVVTFGGEVYDERIRSTRVFEAVETGSLTAVRARIPDGATYVSSGAFAQHNSEVLPGRLSLRSGLRVGHFTFRTREAPAFDVESERVPAAAVTFHSGAVVTVIDGLNLTFTASRGFRAANAVDLGAIGVTGGGFEITPGQAKTLGARIGTNDGEDAVSTDQPVGALGPESLYALEAGLKLRTTRIDAEFTIFDLELREVIERRTAIFPTPVVGQIIAGHLVERQDSDGRAFVAADPRPMATRVNVDRARVRGLEVSLTARLSPQWRAGGYVSMANGRELDTDVPLRRMPPPLGGAHVRYGSTSGRYWVEGTVQFAAAQRRLSPGDLSDARIGATRSRASIAAFFDGTATDLGLVRDGVLIATGETLPDVQRRVLGDADSAPLFTESAGFVVIGARAGFSVSPTTELSVIGENLTDRNYRWHGSGVDGAGANVQVRLQYRF